MTSGAPVSPGEIVGTADQRVWMYGVSWKDYQVMLALRGRSAVPRLSYLDGVLELMSPSQTHEVLKSRIGHLVEVYLLHHDIDFDAVGSWTLSNEPAQRGAEPDECYLLGPDRNRDHPDLAIEVNWTSGGIDKLEIYRQLSVAEVWIWKKNKIRVFELVGDRYEERPDSQCLSGIDLERVAALIQLESASAAIKAYRSELESEAT